MPDPTTIQPGQRYAYKSDDEPGYVVLHAWGENKHPDAYPLIEPDELPSVPVGATVLNVATGERFEWTEDHGWAATANAYYLAACDVRGEHMEEQNDE